MKSAGQRFSNSAVLPGNPSVAHEATAESNQTSKMSSTRFIVPPQSHGIVTSSTYGRCGSGSGLPLRLLEFLYRADDPVLVALCADPDRDRDAPVPLA